MLHWIDISGATIHNKLSVKGTVVVVAV